MHPTAQVLVRTAAFALSAIAFAPPCLAEDAVVGKNPPSTYVKPDVHHAPYGELKIVVPLTTDDKNIQTMKLRNIANGVKAVGEWEGKLAVKVVIYAKGLTLLKDPDATVRQKLDRLRAQGVQFVVCGNTLFEQGIDFHSLYNVTDADIVPSGFAEVAFLQAREQYVIDPSL